MKVLNENARGYVCLDCNNSELFEGKSYLYRLYKAFSRSNDSPDYDFDNEIVCPNEMRCFECLSWNIGIEVETGKIVKNHKITDSHGMWLVGDRWLLDVTDSNDLKDLIKIIIESEGENNSSEAYSHLMKHGWDDWNWNEEIFSESVFSLVKIASSGIIRQDENGLGDEDSDYEEARFIGIY